MGEDEKKEIEIMKPDAFVDLTRQIAEAGGDQGKIVSLLTQVQTGYENLYATHIATEDKSKKTEQENKKLKEYNMELFMERGERLRETTEKGEVKTEARQRAETMTFEKLFEEKEK